MTSSDKKSNITPKPKLPSPSSSLISQNRFIPLSPYSSHYSPRPRPTYSALAHIPTTPSTPQPPPPNSKSTPPATATAAGTILAPYANENHLCNLCGNDSHDGYDCQQQFPFVYEHEPSYNQNYDVSTDGQQYRFFGNDQIQTPQYPDVQENPLTNDEFEAYTNANDDKMNDLEIKFDQFQKQCEQMQDELLNQMRNFMQNFHDGLLIPPPGEGKEHEATTDTELPSTEDIQPLPVQEPPLNSDICQFIREECFVEVPEEQKQNTEKTMLDLVKICHHKHFLCMYDNVEDLIESALDTKLLSINSIKSQSLDKQEQEVKNVEEQPAECRNQAEKSLQNFRVIHKSSISFKNTSQIYSVHAVAPILSTREPENSLSMGYEHLSVTPETESDEVTKSNTKNLLPIPSKCEVTLEDKRECDELICENPSTIDVRDNHSDTFSDSKIDDDISVYDDDFEDIEYVEASLPDPEIVSVEEENSVEEDVVQQKEEEVNFEDLSQVQDIVLREKLLSITRLISNIESL
nr:hypothetical protein [Tanacetum cinerariifolium]